MARCRKCHGNVGVCGCVITPTFRERAVKKIMGNKWGIVLCIVWFLVFVAIFLCAEGFQYTEPIDTTTLNTITNETGTFKTQMVVTTIYYFNAWQHAGMYLLFFMGALIPVWFWLAIYLNDRDWHRRDD
jgi:hypothetical protein